MDVLVDRAIWGIGGFIVLICAAFGQFLQGDDAVSNALIASGAITLLAASRMGYFTDRQYASDGPQMLGALCFFAAVICPLTPLALAGLLAIVFSMAGLALILVGTVRACG